MNHDEFDRLAESAFDGPEDGAARTRLAELAAGDPELAARWEDLQSARGALAGARLEPLPEGLHPALMVTVRGERAGRSGRESWLSFVRAAIQTRPAYALGGAVAAGFALGVLGLGLLLGGFRAEPPIEGGTSASLPPTTPPVVTTALEQGGVRVELTARRVAEGTIVRLEARAGAPADVVLMWEPAALRLAGVRWEGPEAPVFEPAPGRVALRVPAAAGCELSFVENEPGAGALRATLRTPVGDREETLRLPR